MSIISAKVSRFLYNECLQADTVTQLFVDATLRLMVT